MVARLDREIGAGQWERCIAMARSGLASHPDWQVARARRAVCETRWHRDAASLAATFQTPPSASTCGETLVESALCQYVSGNYDMASTLAKRAIAHGAVSSKVWRIYGASSCYLKQVDEARSTWDHLSAIDRHFMSYVCDRNHLKVP